MKGTKITPDYVFTMLKEVKELADKGEFYSSDFSKKHPSFYTFRTMIYKKGLMVKEGRKEKWVSIEPNFIMAKAIYKLYRTYMDEAKQKYNTKIQRQKSITDLNEFLDEQKEPIEKEVKKSVGKPLAELPPSDLQEMIEAKNEEIQTIYNSYDEICKENQNLKIDITNLTISFKVQKLENEQSKEKVDKFYKEANEHIQQLQNTIQEQEDLIQKKTDKLQNQKDDIEVYKVLSRNHKDEIKKMQDQISEFQNEVAIYKPQQSKFRDLTYDEIWGTKPITSKNSRTFKVFGIPIFSIDNK